MFLWLLSPTCKGRIPGKDLHGDRPSPSPVSLACWLTAAADMKTSLQSPLLASTAVLRPSVRGASATFPLGPGHCYSGGSTARLPRPSDGPPASSLSSHWQHLGVVHCVPLSEQNHFHALVGQAEYLRVHRCTQMIKTTPGVAKVGVTSCVPGALCPVGSS